MLGLNDLIEVGEKSSESYAGTAVGNYAEAMSINISCFRDVRTSVDCHVGIITGVLPIDSPLRFSKATPKEIMRTLDRLWDPVTGVTPNPAQIVQDITRLKEFFTVCGS